MRFVYLVHQIVPDSYNVNSHGLFVTRGLAAVTNLSAPVISALTATPVTLLDTGSSQLTVTASDPDNGPQPLQYTWTIISGGGTLTEPYGPTTIYLPENVSDSRTVIVQIEVSDGENTVSRTVSLQVNDANAPPPNAPPVIGSLTAIPASLLDNQTSQLAVTAVDSDDGPQPLSYQWTIVSGGGMLDNATSATPVYTPSDVVGRQTVVLKVEVSDGSATVSGNLTLTVEDANPPPPGPELLHEDFSNGSLADWTVRDEGTVEGPSRWQIINGELAQLSNIRSADSTLAKPGTIISYNHGSGWTDYRLKFKMRSADDDLLGVVFRQRDHANYYRFAWDKQRAGRGLVKNVNGKFTLLASDNVPYDKNRDYEVEIVAVGTQLEVWIDGVRIFQVNDTAHSGGTFGFYTWQNAGSYYDDMRANAAP